MIRWTSGSVASDFGQRKVDKAPSASPLQGTYMGMAMGRLGEGTFLMGDIGPFVTLWLQGLEEADRSFIRCLAGSVDVIAPYCGPAPYTRSQDLKAMAQVTRRIHRDAWPYYPTG
jgi:uroporphyrinogen-III decarboxylase